MSPESTTRQDDGEKYIDKILSSENSKETSSPKRLSRCQRNFTSFNVERNDKKHKVVGTGTYANEKGERARDLHWSTKGRERVVVKFADVIMYESKCQRNYKQVRIDREPRRRAWAPSSLRPFHLQPPLLPLCLCNLLLNGRPMLPLAAFQPTSFDALKIERPRTLLNIEGCFEDLRKSVLVKHDLTRENVEAEISKGGINSCFQRILLIKYN